MYIPRFSGGARSIANVCDVPMPAASPIPRKTAATSSAAYTSPTVSATAAAAISSNPGPSDHFRPKRSAIIPFGKAQRNASAEVRLMRKPTTASSRFSASTACTGRSVCTMPALAIENTAVAIATTANVRLRKGSNDNLARCRPSAPGAASSSGRVSFTIVNTTTTMTTLLTPFSRNTDSSPYVAASTPPNAGPATNPSRVAILRNASTRPLLSIVVTSESRTFELVAHMATPICPMTSSTKNVTKSSAKYCPTLVMPRTMGPISTIGLRPSLSVRNPVMGPVNARGTALAASITPTRKTLPVTASTNSGRPRF